MLAHSIFEEKYVFKLQKKTENLIDHYYDDLDDEEKAEILSERIEELVTKYNNALSKNAPAGVLISPGRTEEIVSIINDELDIDNVDVEQISIDSKDIFYIKDQRNKRLFLVQIISILGFVMMILLGILQLILFMKAKKRL